MIIRNWYHLLLLIIGVQSSYRFLEYLYKSKQSEGRKTLIYGAGRWGAYALKEVIHNPALGITPTRFIEDDPRKKGRLINGYPILADLNHLDTLLEENSISEIVISNSHLSKEKLNRLTEICKSRNIDLYRFEVSLENISTTAPP